MTESVIVEAPASGEPARPRVETVAAELLAKIARAQRASDEDPFGNPVLSVALGIARRMDNGQLDDEALWALVRHLRDAAFADRARRLAASVGGTGRADNEAALQRVAGVVLRPDPLDSPVRWAEFREAVERTRYAAVFTAHPTFALPAEVAAALAAREALGSTGVGGGIAVPHARIATLAAPSGFLARLDRPVGFDAVDGRPVDLVFLLLSPAADAEHLRALAAVSRRLRTPEVAQAMRAAPQGALRAALLGA